MKVTMEMNQVLIEQGDLFFHVFGNNSSRHDFVEFIYIVTDESFTAGGGLL